MLQQLTSISEVIDALGGIQAVADLTGRKYMAAAQDKRLGKFPSRTRDVMTVALAEKGKTAPASLWGMLPVQERAAS